MKKFLVILIAVFGFSNFTWAESEKDHDHDHDHAKEAEHSEEHEHSDHEEEEEASSVVGPEKGILEKGDKGFKLSPEAIQTFNLKMGALSGKTMVVSRSSIVEIKNDKSIFRVKDGWFKRIPIKVLKKDKQNATIELSEFTSGDQYVVDGVGFVRTAEIIVEQGASHGHSH